MTVSPFLDFVHGIKLKKNDISEAGSASLPEEGNRPGFRKIIFLKF